MCEQRDAASAQHLVVHGVTFIDELADGTCAWRAVARQVKGHPSQFMDIKREYQHFARELGATGLLPGQPEEEARKIFSAQVQDQVRSTRSRIFAAYIRAVARGSFWAGELELSVLARLYARPVVVFYACTSGGVSARCFGGDGDSSGGHPSVATLADAIILGHVPCDGGTENDHYCSGIFSCAQAQVAAAAAAAAAEDASPSPPAATACAIQDHHHHLENPQENRGGYLLRWKGCRRQYPRSA